MGAAPAQEISAAGNETAALIEHLLRHRSGLTREFGEYFADSRDVARNIEDVIDCLNSAPLLFTPGERQSYSNANYILLADLIRQVSGIPYYAVLDSVIPGTAGMSSTGLDHDAAREGFLTVFTHFLDRDATCVVVANTDAVGRSGIGASP